MARGMMAAEAQRAAMQPTRKRNCFIDTVDSMAVRVWCKEQEEQLAWPPAVSAWPRGPRLPIYIHHVTQASLLTRLCVVHRNSSCAAWKTTRGIDRVSAHLHCICNQHDHAFDWHVRTIITKSHWPTISVPKVQVEKKNAEEAA